MEKEKLLPLSGFRDQLEPSKSAILDGLKKIFQSFENLRGNQSPWIVFVDKDGYYWIEEYPVEPPEQVLNGFIYGIYGVYDYYNLTKDPKAQEIFSAGLTTLKHYLPDFRNPGGMSFYDLKHKRPNQEYHFKHIEQLKMLYKMTGDKFFKEMADNFYHDFH